MNTKKRILIVEDEKELVELITFRLEGEGFHVLTAFDGVEALATVEKERPDLILLDILMPKMNGYEVCRRLKADERYRDIPIIYLTAKAQEEEMKAAIEMGADAYIAKPFEPADLIGTINKLIEE